MSTQNRHLAAILFTDISGYTGIMQLDEQHAVQMIKHYHEALENTVNAHHGEILNDYGDGSLCTFNSVYDALVCAIELQQDLQKEPAVPLRIGLHVGEILFEGDNVLGDGVNVASRIQSIGIANSILFSKEVYHNIKNRPEFKTTFLGEFEFKNVEEPVPVYALVMPGLAVPDKTEITGKLKDKKSITQPIKSKLNFWVAGLIILLVLVYSISQYVSNRTSDTNQEDKSIAVLPFINLSHIPDEDYFSNGVAEDILNHLVKIADLKVKSRTSALQYKNTTKSNEQIGKELGVDHLLSGSVRKVDNQIRVVVQLIDAKNDIQLWSATYDRELKDILTIQSEIAIETAQALKAQLTSRELTGIKRDNTPDIIAYDYFLQAREYFNMSMGDHNYLDKALSFINRAIQLDSAFAQAVALKGRIMYQSRIYGAGEKVWRDSSLYYTGKSIELDNQLPDGYFARALIRYYLGDMNAYESDLVKAYTLSPNDPEITERYGYLLIDNKKEIGAALIFKALENKYSSNDPRYYLSWADALVYLDDEGWYGRERILSQCIKLYPDFMTAYFELAYLYREKGDFVKSFQLYKKIYEMNPDDFRAANEMAWSYFWSKNYDSAIHYWSTYKEYESRFSDTTQRVAFRHRLGMTYAIVGNKKQADRLFSEQLMIINGMIAKQQSRGIWGSSMAGLYYDLAVCEAYFGNKDKMITALDSAYFRYHFFWNWGLNHEPVWEKYTTDEKLIALKNRNNEIVEFKKNAFRKALVKSKINNKIKVLLNY